MLSPPFSEISNILTQIESNPLSYKIQDFVNVLKSTFSCYSCKHNYSFILNPDQDLWFILPYPVLIEHESAPSIAFMLQIPGMRISFIFHEYALNHVQPLFLAQPIVLTKHCLALVQNFFLNLFKNLFVLPKMYKPAFIWPRVAAFTAFLHVNSHSWIKQ